MLQQLGVTEAVNNVRKQFSMISSALLWDGQGENQIDRVAVFRIKRQWFDQLQEKRLNFFCAVDSSMGYSNAVTESCAAQVFSCTNAFKDFLASFGYRYSLQARVSEQRL